MRAMKPSSILLAIAFCASFAAHAANSEISGTTPAGSAYRIVVPEDWSAGDGLVLVQHGFRFQKIVSPELGPSAQAMLDDGFAIAAPGYRQAGWAVFDAVADNAELLDLFRAQIGEPGTVIAHGGSMGALIALKMAESESLRPHIDGVVALCPAADGVGVWDHAFDVRVAYDALCNDIPGGALPRGEEPTPWASNLEVMAQAPIDPLGYPARVRSLPPIQACLALHLPDAQRNDAQKARVTALKAIAGTDDEDALAVQLAYAYFGLADLLRSPDKLGGANPFYNYLVVDGERRDLSYAANSQIAARLPAGFDDRIERVLRDDFARLDFQRVSTPDGTVRVPIVSMHTQRDGIVSATMQRFMRQRFGELAKGVGIGVVREASATHCGFSQGEYDAAWDVARAWVARGDAVAPVTTDFQAACETRQAGACRFDEDAVQAATVTGESHLRYRLNDLGSRAIGLQTFGGLWWDPARPAQGLMIEELDDPIGTWGAGEQRVAVAWYTWAPQHDPNPGARWFYGVGRVYGANLSVDLLEVRGGRFGNALDPQAITYAPWGRVDIAFDAAHPTLRYAGPPGYGSGEMHLHQLMRAGTGIGSSLSFSPPLGFDFERIGTYYDPLHPAGGWVLDQFDNDDASNRVGSLLVWFTWDANGRPLWMFGLDDNDADGLSFDLRWAAGGGRFEPGYTLSQVQLLPWGELTLEGDSCVQPAVTAVQWRAETHGFGDGDVDVVRLTDPTILHTGLYCWTPR
jgi:hypothetical protein